MYGTATGDGEPAATGNSKGGGGDTSNPTIKKPDVEFRDLAKVLKEENIKTDIQKFIFYLFLHYLSPKKLRTH